MIGPLPTHSFAHAGIVVNDVNAAMEELSASLGVKWAEPIDVPVGDLVVRVTYAQPGPPWLELVSLVEGPPGTIWDATDGPKLHHLGFWAEDLDETSKILSDGGVPLELDARPLGRPIVFHLGPMSGLRIELHKWGDRAAIYERWGFGEPPPDPVT
jgi:hypothetical protein